MNKIIIIDGNSLLFRAYYATYNPDKSKLMRNEEGIPTNAIFTFSNMIISLIKTLNIGDGFFVAFDKGKHTLRHKEFKEYKANRPPCPEDLLIQMPIAREFLDDLNILYYEDDDIEADDIAGIMAKKATKEGYHVYLYTSDKDYLQLIDDNTTVELIKRGLKDIHEMTPTTFKEEWGFDPIHIIDYKGLMGDPSDNLKGIPKIGDKTAKTLIIKYQTFENIYDHANELTNSIKTSLLENVEQGRMCCHLAKMNFDISLPFSSSQTIYKGYDFNLISNFAKKYNFTNLVNKLPSQLRLKNTAQEDIEFIKITELESLQIPKEFGFAIDLDENSYHDSEIYGFSFSFLDKNYYIDYEDALKSISFKNILEDSNYTKYVFDFKRIRYILARINIDIVGLKFDLLLATYLLDTSINNDINSIMTYYQIDINYAFDKTNLLFIQSNPLLTSIISHYSISLYEKIIARLLETDQYSLLNNIENPLSIVLSNMEIEGFPLNKNTLMTFKKYYEERIEGLKKDIFSYAKHEFNINSTKELGNVLFNELHLKGNKKLSTDYDHLKELRGEHLIIDKIIDYRKYSKILSTYINGLVPYIKNDGKIHAIFNQAVTQTGRLSSSEPNLQNITIRDEESKQIRKAFYYDDPSLNILSLDYSQIELRILASMSSCETMIEFFNNNQDIHTETAKKVFHLDREPTSLERTRAKAVNFGIVYGISDWGLAEQLEISVDEAKKIILSFNEEFPEIKTYLDGLVESAIKKGYAITLFNRRRYLPELKSDNYQVREFAKRAARNAPIQGSAADLIKIAMIQVDKAFKEHKYEAKIISQIHDELIIKVNDKEKDEVMMLVKNIMENCVKLKVSLKADGGYAKTWFDAK